MLAECQLGLTHARNFRLLAWIGRLITESAAIIALALHQTIENILGYASTWHDSFGFLLLDMACHKSPQI